MSKSGGKKKVLIIDDNTDILFVMRRALEMKAYDVHVSPTYIGLESVQKLAPSLIYLDISLVGYDGCTVARELKGDDRTKHIPIVIITGHVNPAQLAIEAGADDYLPKPFELARLWEMTARYTAT